VLALGSDLTLADNNNSWPGSSPPQPDEVHHKFFFSQFVLFFTSKLVDMVMNVKKINLRSISPPPPIFNMQTVQKELSRLAWDHNKFEEKLQEHKAKADAVDELFTYAQHSVMSTRALLSMAHPPSSNILPCSRTSLGDLSKTNWLPSL